MLWSIEMILMLQSPRFLTSDVALALQWTLGYVQKVASSLSLAAHCGL